MDLFQKRLARRGERDYAGRVAALEDYVEYLRQQGEYGFSQMGQAVTGQTEQENS